MTFVKGFFAIQQQFLLVHGDHACTSRAEWREFARASGRTRDGVLLAQNLHFLRQEAFQKLARDDQLSEYDDRRQDVHKNVIIL